MIFRLYHHHRCIAQSEDRRAVEAAQRLSGGVGEVREEPLHGRADENEQERGR